MEPIQLSNKKGVQHIVAALAALGLKEVVICPGSRNAPFILSFNRHPAFHCTSIRDERSAAFFALGKAIELRQPVAVVCTSGSASLNFAPAISEAYYQGIPLIIITADRPKEWTDQGDGQTINQTDVYHNFIRKSYDLKGDATSGQELWFISRCVSEGYNIAAVSNPGPVHFNVPMNEPLYGAEEVSGLQPKTFRHVTVTQILPGQSLIQLVAEFSESAKIMILVGQQRNDVLLEKTLKGLAKRKDVVVLTESTSNIHDELFIENIDRCITNLPEYKARELMPDLLITLGGAIVSKRIKALLRKFSPAHHWNVDEHHSFMDTYQSLTRSIAMKPTTLFNQILPTAKESDSDFASLWRNRKEKMKNLHEAFCREAKYSDFKVFDQIYKNIPGGEYLHLSNSSPIRYAQLFDNKKIASSWSNRGTSGIDGCSSTAIGAASASPKKDFILITGDVAFRYDIHALWNQEAIKNLNIIVLNNGGGNIFRIIPGPRDVPELDQFFETSVQGDVSDLAKLFGWNYLSATDGISLIRSLETFFDLSTEKTILEVFTDAKKNPEVLDEYWKYLKENAES